MQHSAAAAQPVPVAFWSAPAAHGVPWSHPQVHQAHQMQPVAPMFVWMPMMVQTGKGGRVPLSTASEGLEFSAAWGMPHRGSSGSMPEVTRRGSSGSLPEFSETWSMTHRGSSGSVASVDLPEEPAGRARPPMRSSAGSRALQAALDEAAGDEERAALAEELRGHVWEAIRCPSANHVLQKCIVVLPPQAMQFILDELVAGPDGRGRGIGQAARHRYGCRVLERLVEQGRPEWCSVLLDALVADSTELFVHPWGHFVIQHLLEHAPREWRRRLHRVVEQNVGLAATKPWARAVVSTAIAHAEEDDAAALARALCGQPGLLSGMACTRHGHVGVLHLVRGLAGPEGEEVRRQLTEEAEVFRHTRFGRAVLAALGDA
ncbi:unnamed protein product [Prorocentrum cordatum]|uniref:PUM-HD domain-containing protein n=1 Tax=Prorocentrum cordatum TaxID=2364126 RepID=A0ABN9TKY4_9DINO|nr:unnamed protein product [Polarella glacialis]